MIKIEKDILLGAREDYMRVIANYDVETLLSLYLGLGLCNKLYYYPSLENNIFWKHFENHPMFPTRDKDSRHWFPTFFHDVPQILSGQPRIDFIIKYCLQPRLDLINSVLEEDKYLIT